MMLSLFPRTLPRYSVLTTALIFVATSTILWTTLYNVPILSSKLPAYTGPHRVGAIDLEADVAESRIISSDAVFKETGKPAFQLDTVFFTLFYPAGDNLRVDQNIDKEKHKASHLWVPRPLSLVAEGYARFASLSFFPVNQIFTFFLWLLVGSTRIPAEVDVPIYTPENLGGTHRHHNGGASDASTPPKFPIIIFTHGMAGMRTSYSQYCGELASRGYVVAAIEHRDGSGPGSMIMRKSGRTSKAVHMKAKDLESDPALKGDALKQTQLAFREAEMEESIRMLREINAGRGDWYEHQNPRHEGENLMSFKDRLDLDTIVVAGHSYGATGALLALKDAPSEKLPFKGAIIQDPGKSSGPLNKNIRVPTLIINSGSWTASQSTFYGRPHFEVVRDVARTVLKAGHKAWFLTLSGTAHPSVTDAPLIEKWLMRAVTGTKLNERTAINKYVQITKEFVMFLQDGKTRGVLGAGVTDEDGPLAEGKAEHEGKDWSGFWKVHVAPE